MKGSNGEKIARHNLRLGLSVIRDGGSRRAAESITGNRFIGQNKIEYLCAPKDKAGNDMIGVDQLVGVVMLSLLLSLLHLFAHILVKSGYHSYHIRSFCIAS